MSDTDRWWAQPQLPLPHWAPDAAAARVRLVALTPEHAAGYLRAAGDADERAEVFRWLAVPPLVDRAAADQHIATACAARARGERLAYAQLDPHTGAVLGTTSLYDVVPALRTAAIGHTWLARRAWRTGVNTAAKLLLLRYCFDELGTARVVWHTDIRNERSQAAIARLGATREGVLRKHRYRWDGSWRDTVQYAMTDDDWPAARDRLQAALER